MITSKQKDLTQTRNLHRNFKDLKPHYDELRYGRAKNLANHWLDQLGKNLKEQVRQEKRKNFIEFIQSGNRLSFKEIQNLGKTLKGDYTSEILKEDDKINEYVAQRLDDALNKHNEISELIWDIVDVQDTWDTAIDNINQAVMKKAISNGIKKEQFKFAVPDIQDMLVYHNGTICKKCRLNFYCEKHKLVKKERQFDIDEDDFDRV